VWRNFSPDEAYAPASSSALEQSRLIRLSPLITLASCGGEYVISVTLKDCEVHLQQSKSIGGVTSRRACGCQTIKLPFLFIANLLCVDECILNAGKSGVILFVHIGFAQIDRREARAIYGSPLDVKPGVLTHVKQRRCTSQG
jgi:hypothetical protein